MTTVTRWDPFADLRGTMDRLFDEGFSRPWRLIPAPNSEGYEATFPVEVSETESDIEVKASLPGVKPEEVEITVAQRRAHDQGRAQEHERGEEARLLPS